MTKLGIIDTVITAVMVDIDDIDVQDDPKGKCPVCGSTAFYLVEHGYSRTTTLRWEGDGWHGYTDGWDDMSEQGQTEFVVCESCFEVFRSPGIEDWD